MDSANRAAYTAAKAALVGLTKNTALDFAARRMVNCVCPGFVRTPFIRALLADPERTARVTALHPLVRLGEPEEVARAMLFLGSNEAARRRGTTRMYSRGVWRRGGDSNPR